MGNRKRNFIGCIYHPMEHRQFWEHLPYHWARAIESVYRERERERITMRVITRSSSVAERCPSFYYEDLLVFQFINFS